MSAIVSWVRAHCGTTAGKVFFWVDIEGRKVFEYKWHTRQVVHWSLSERVSVIFPESNSSSVLLGVQGGLVRLHLDTGETTHLLSIEQHRPDNRTNDGRCDVSGRLWIGTMHVDGEENAGALYCIDHDNVVQRKVEGVTIPNGIAWTRDNSKMYHVDTTGHVVNSYHFNANTGEIVFDRIAVRIPPEFGSPDGMCIDENENLWIAHWGGFGVHCWDPRTGDLVSRVRVPVPNVSNCAFGGDDLSVILITTARQGMTDEQLTEFPESGNVFQCRPGVRGVHSHYR